MNENPETFWKFLHGTDHVESCGFCSPMTYSEIVSNDFKEHTDLLALFEGTMNNAIWGLGFRPQPPENHLSPVLQAWRRIFGH